VSDAEVQRRLDALLASPGADPAAFSPFFGDGAARAGALAGELRRVAQSDGLPAALAAAEEAARSEPAGLVKRALKVFVTHEPLAAAALALPTVEAVESERVEGRPPRPQPPPPPRLPTARRPGLEMAPPPDAPPPDEDAQEVPSLTQPPAERALDWYREDPFANDHHAHWHIAYPRDGSGANTVQQRHGELFFYMHQQMLARYDTERVIAGLGPVEPYPPRTDNGAPDYRATISEGYGSRGYTTRRPGRSFSELQGAVAECAAAHALLRDAIASKRLRIGVGGEDVGALTEPLLGAATETSVLRTDTAEIDVGTMDRAFGNLHGSGHGNAGGLGEGPDPLTWGAVMYWTESAICDPFFYRWHRHIDDLCAEFQDSSGERNDPATFAPRDVSFGAARTIVLCLSGDIPGADGPGFDFDAFAREELGDDLSGNDALLTSELLTRFMRSRVTTGIPAWRNDRPGPDRVTYTTTHLVHEPFTYFIRVENAAAENRTVTVRTFLALAQLAGERRAWIELDKFVATLAPGVNVLARPDARSSVIKRRGVSAPGVEPLEPGAVDQWCDCGWPYSLLLPSGASDAQGTPFKLMVALTDYALDHEPNHTRTCGSMSFCGALENYPDKRKMGYPFDRPFASPIADTMASAPSMAAIDLRIRCENERPPE
jgi:hypothetical protein